MSFGRKGVIPGQAPLGGPRAAAQSGPRPATRIDPEAAEIAARREAFLAAERARREEQGGEYDTLSGLRNAPRPANRREEPVGDSWSPISEDQLRAARGGKSGRTNYLMGDPRKRTLLLAYFYWYFCAPIGLHRIYCGQKETAIYQMALFVGGLVLLAIWAPLGIASLIAWFVWILADLFLIPGMMRRFKAEHADYLEFA